MNTKQLAEDYNPVDHIPSITISGGPVSLKGIRTCITRTGLMWSADLFCGRVMLARMENRGDGSETRTDVTDKTLYREFEQAVELLPPLTVGHAETPYTPSLWVCAVLDALDTVKWMKRKTRNGIMFQKEQTTGCGLMDSWVVVSARNVDRKWRERQRDEVIRANPGRVLRIQTGISWHCRSGVKESKRK